MLTIKNPRTFDWANMALSDCCEGNAADTYFTLKLYNLLFSKLEELKLTEFFEELIVPATNVFSKMEYDGLHVSNNKLNMVGKALKDFNIDVEDSLYSYKQVGSKDNLSSTSTLCDILYTREGGFELYPPDKTAKGSPSVSAPTLKILLEQIEKELSARK